jgi:hypothetical protein
MVGEQGCLVFLACVLVLPSLRFPLPGRRVREGQSWLRLVWESPAARLKSAGVTAPAAREQRRPRHASTRGVRDEHASTESLLLNTFAWTSVVAGRLRGAVPNADRATPGNYLLAITTETTARSMAITTKTRKVRLA